mmetsp:Transcript_33748/g.82814  ORF Transcript_33748/g.82814 Transcript_33748/m.82814 type:complete len:324 (+) Transcript_33748:96-1067(+)
MEFVPESKWDAWDTALRKGRVSRAGKFENASGLSLAFYSWEVPNPVGVVIFSHGHGVHATFELLHSVKPGGRRTRFEGSWPESFNKAGFSVYAVDHQGHGRSDCARGKRCFFERVDDLVDDFTQFVRLVRAEVGPKLPAFMLGMSMGGYVVVNSAIKDEKLVDGVVLLAPMLSLNKLASRGLNRLLLPLLSVISMFLPTLPMAETARNTKFPSTQREVELDLLTWPSGVKRTRARVAAEYWLGTQRTQRRMHEMNIPLITFHGRDDPMTDPESSSMLHQRAACSDKSLQWVDNVFHDLMHEQPTCDNVCNAIVDWMVARTTRP